jgi:transposase
MYRQDGFQAHYHLRSNVESVFSSVKRKFGGAVRSKKQAAQVNEILCKILCYNLSILAQAMQELGIEPAFGARAAA